MEKYPIKSKTDLETLIFHLAALQGQQVLSCKGVLVAPFATGKLARLIEIYNQFFAIENKLLVEEEITCIKEIENNEYQMYVEKARHYPLGFSFYLDIYQS